MDVDTVEESEQLVLAIASGDREAEQRLVSLYLPKVRLVLKFRTRNAEYAADLLQDVMMEAICALRNGQLREPAKLPAFILGIARNLLNDHFRKTARQPASLESPDELVDLTDATEAIAEQQRHELVRRAISVMEPTDQSILQMTLAEGLKPGVIAARLGINPDVVRQRKLRATRKLVDFVSRLSQKRVAVHIKERVE
ncbi:MAG: sigma-70 family RNA polymerase sigma factor [Terracidiphilus sp.]